MEFASSSAGQSETATSVAENKSLEQLLLEKNRALQNELTQLKVANQQLNGENLFLCNMQLKYFTSYLLS